MEPNDKGAKSISQFFQEDHREIDEIVSAVRHDLLLATDGSVRNLESIIASFDRFDSRLERHIHWEEEILFPAVEEASPGLREGPGQVMRMEHEEIRHLKESCRRNLVGSTENAALLQGAKTDLDAVLSILMEHNQKEEMVYYPMADAKLTPEQIAGVLARVQEGG